MKGQAAVAGGNGNIQQMKRAFNNRHRFDFEVGYLVSSPCKECPRRDEFPRCAETCKILDRIQTVLSETISCSRSA